MNDDIRMIREALKVALGFLDAPESTYDERMQIYKALAILDAESVLRREAQARAEKAEGESKALRELLAEMWPFIEESDAGPSGNTLEFNLALDHYRAALAATEEGTK
jgi:hypothetical protein